LLAAGLQVLDNSPRLPKMPDVARGVYLREGPDTPKLRELADQIAESVGHALGANMQPGTPLTAVR